MALKVHPGCEIVKDKVEKEGCGGSLHYSACIKRESKAIEAGLDAAAGEYWRTNRLCMRRPARGPEHC